MIISGGVFGVKTTARIQLLWMMGKQLIPAFLAHPSIFFLFGSRGGANAAASHYCLALMIWKMCRCFFENLENFFLSWPNSQGPNNTLGWCNNYWHKQKHWLTKKKKKNVQTGVIFQQNRARCQKSHMSSKNTEKYNLTNHVSWPEPNSTIPPPANCKTKRWSNTTPSSKEQPSNLFLSEWKRRKTLRNSNCRIASEVNTERAGKLLSFKCTFVIKH